MGLDSSNNSTQYKTLRLTDSPNATLIYGPRFRIYAGGSSGSMGSSHTYTQSLSMVE
jgi:hypothetical protein